MRRPGQRADDAIVRQRGWMNTADLRSVDGDTRRLPFDGIKYLPEGRYRYSACMSRVPPVPQQPGPLHFGWCSSPVVHCFDNHAEFVGFAVSCRVPTSAPVRRSAGRKLVNS